MTINFRNLWWALFGVMNMPYSVAMYVATMVCADNLYIINFYTINYVHLFRLLSLGLLFSLWMLMVSDSFVVQRIMCGIQLLCA